MPFVGIGVGIGRQRFASGIFAAYAARVAADGGVTEAGACVDAISGISLNSSLLLVPSGYKSGVVYSQIPTNGNGDLTFTRASDATRVNSDGEIEVVGSGVPRLDYSQGSCPALLLEPQRTNLALYSEQIDNASWTKLNSSITANTTTAPNGTLTADKLTATATTSTHILLQQPAGSVSGATSTVSIYAKSAGLSNIQFLNNAGGLGVANFNLSAETAVLLSGVSASIENVGNGWYRCIMTYTPTTSGNYNVQIRLADSSGNTTFLGNGTDGVFIWGAQLEAGAYPTSYIPTTSATATRLADSCSKTGISSLIGQTEGTMFVEFDIPSNTENGDIIAVRVGTSSANGFFVSYRSASVVQLIVRISSTNALIFQRTGAYPIGKNKLAVAYKNGDFAISLNGTATQVDTSTITMPTSLDSVALFGGNLYTQTLPIQYAQVLLFPTRLSNSELQSLTTL